MQIKKELIDWLSDDYTGMSSIALCRHMLGFESDPNGFPHPYDADDRGRCIRLLNIMPKWWDRLNEMKKHSGWDEQIPLIIEEAKIITS